MVKIVGLSGSPRRERNTEYLLNAALDAASKVEGAETELIRLPDYRILPCDGCNACAKEGKCPLDEQDDVERLREKLKEADAVIIAAPSYFASVPGITKNFMDRSRPLKMKGHLLAGKVISALSVSGVRNGGGEAVVDEIARFGLIHGMIVVGGVGDPLTQASFGIGSLQGDAGWRRTSGDEIALQNSRSVGKRVAEIALALKRGSA
jgi:multimeric flavodoxin WrbA